MGGICGGEGEEVPIRRERKLKVETHEDIKEEDNIVEKSSPLIKVVLVGNSGVGKTSILRHLNEEPFDNDSEGTVAVDFAEVTLKVDSKKYKLQIWDTAGQERFRSIVKNYYRGAHCICLVYDVTSPSSFSSISSWIKDIYLNTPEDDNPVFVLLGNKCDLVHRRLVSRSMAKVLGEDHEFIVNKDCSALDGFNIKKSFKSLVRRIENE